MNRKAFTLIELLIVVAIIAILAAIAVPNFLEAQIRAKIGRCRADMRTIATALESYRIDNNKYPHIEGFARASKLPNGPGQCDRGGVDQCYNLSTPVAYLSTCAMMDPFVNAKSGVSLFGVIPWMPKDTSVGYHYLNVDMRYPGNTGNRKNPKHWYLLSLGPDYLKAPGSLGAYQTNTDPSGTYEWPQYAYDSTNGTISGGDILRWN